MINIALSTIRKYNKISEKDLAYSLSMSTAYLRQLESGAKDPSVATLMKYSEYFKVPLASFIAFSDTLSGDNRSTKKYISRKLLNILDWVAKDTRPGY